VPEKDQVTGDTPPEVEHELEKTWPTDVGPFTGTQLIESLESIFTEANQLDPCGCGVDESDTERPVKLPDVVAAPDREAVFPTIVKESPFNSPSTTHLYGGVPPDATH
jgi:hypothetical protein